MSTPAAIRVHKVSKQFRLPHEKVTSVKSIFTHPFKSKKSMKKASHTALTDVSFEVKQGEFFGIVGRNGSGKSTLLKLIAQIYQPSEGSISVEGRLVPFIELGVGFNPELTGRENVYLNGALMGFSVKEIDAMYDDIVEFAELEEFMDQKLKNYSSGMQVRLAFSVATRSKADILLIDEVLAVGDADFQRKCYQYFRSLKKEKTTVVFVSHDMEAVREYCDECVLIDNAQVIYKGSPEVAAEKYIKLFNTKENDDTEVQVETSIRWGDESATFETVEATVEGDKLHISACFHANTKVLEDPILGFIVKNSAGVPLCGTNSKILRKKIGVCLPGEPVTVDWKFDNIFGDDELTVEAAITHRDGVTQADWWHEAASFKVSNDQSTPHPVSPKVTMSIKR